MKVNKVIFVLIDSSENVDETYWSDLRIFYEDVNVFRDSSVPIDSTKWTILPLKLYRATGWIFLPFRLNTTPTKQIISFNIVLFSNAFLCCRSSVTVEAGGSLHSF